MEELDPRLNELYLEYKFKCQKLAIQKMPLGLKVAIKILRDDESKNNDKLRALEVFDKFLPGFNKNIDRDKGNDLEDIDKIQEQLKKYGIK